jgi:hypothetical protein
MPGMVSLDTITEAGDATGQAFERILADALRAHFTQSRLLCVGERTQGKAREAKELAAAIAMNAAEQNSRLDRLRPAPSAPGGTPTAKRP